MNKIILQVIYLHLRDKCMVWEEMLFQEFQDGCHCHHVAMVSKS